MGYTRVRSIQPKQDRGCPTVIPFLSPIPRTDTSTWVAPASRAEYAFAVAHAVSLWKCVSISQAKTRLARRTNAMGTPGVSTYRRRCGES